MKDSSAFKEIWKPWKKFLASFAPKMSGIRVSHLPPPTLKQNPQLGDLKASLSSRWYRGLVQDGLKNAFVYEASEVAQVVASRGES
jgi:hypothetical protein